MIRKNRKKTGELALFFEIWNSRPHRCENNLCTKRIESFSKAEFHHVQTKGARPDRRLDPDNIVILCPECHRAAHQEGNSVLDLNH